VQRTASRSAIDPADELTMLDPRAVSLTATDSGFEPARQGLHRGAVTEILQTLARCDPNPLLLLLDVRHREKTRGRGRGGW
jgi:hypothetical protein